jgi:hypothetical protein
MTIIFLVQPAKEQITVEVTRYTWSFSWILTFFKMRGSARPSYLLLVLGSHSKNFLLFNTNPILLIINNYHCNRGYLRYLHHWKASWIMMEHENNTSSKRVCWHTNTKTQAVLRDVSLWRHKYFHFFFARYSPGTFSFSWRGIVQKNDHSYTPQQLKIHPKLSQFFFQFLQCLFLLSCHKFSKKNNRTLSLVTTLISLSKSTLSNKIMSNQSATTNAPAEPTLCKMGCGFFVSPNTEFSRGRMERKESRGIQTSSDRQEDLEEWVTKPNSWKKLDSTIDCRGLLTAMEFRRLDWIEEGRQSLETRRLYTQ